MTLLGIDKKGTRVGGIAWFWGRAAQGEFSEHCFSKYDQELFTRKNTGVEVNHVEFVTGKGSSKVVCSLTGLFSRGRRLESNLVGPY